MLAEILGQQSWYEPSLRALGQAIAALDASAPYHPLNEFELKYRFAWTLQRSGMATLAEVAEQYKKVFESGIGIVDAGLEKGYRDMVLSRLTASANSAAFALNGGGYCEEADGWLNYASAEIERRATLDLESRAMLAASTAAARACAASPFAPDFFDGTLELIHERADYWVAQRDSERIQDAAQGFMALAAWAYVSGDAERTREAVAEVVAFYQFDRNKTVRERFRNIAVVGDRRMITFLDMVDGIAYDPERYPVRETRDATPKWQWTLEK